LRFGYHRLRAAAFAVLLSVFIVATGAPAPAAASTPADSVIALAKTKLGAPWVHYAVGPRAFDCSGLVYYVFRRTGNLWRIGGRRMSAYGYYMYFKHRGRASRYGGRPGDLVVWGGGSHIGIYLGHGKAISTLTSGVRIHGIFAVRARFTAFLHTRMSVTTVQPAVPVVVAPTAIPTPTAPPVIDPATLATAAPTPTALVQASLAAVADAAASAEPSAMADPAASIDPAISPAPSTDPAITAAAATATGTVTTAVVPGTAAIAKSTSTRRTTVRLNLRTGASTAAHRIRVLHRGMRLTILRARHDSLGRLWYRVRLNSGLTGWVAGWYTR
jgi:SH3 domain-containing protein/NlpC/P60 family protein